jgi:Ca2+-binding EF-hand superfamily protein
MGEEVAMPALSAAQAERVATLFKAWDIDSIGKLPLANFTGASIPIGPHESGVLTKLREMDYDGDGSVTKEEWNAYFAACAVLSQEEFDLIINSMIEAAELICTIIRATRMAAEDEMPPADDLDASVPLSAERIAAVKALFAAWDIDGSGSIDRRKLTGVSEVSFGPFHAQVFKQIKEMDTDGDQLVTLEEMLSFFQAAAALSDDEFEAIRSPMLEVAQEQATIKMLTDMAGGVEGPPEEDMEAITPLSEPRLAELKTLWHTLGGGDGLDVKLEDMEKAEQGSTIGPHSVSVLKELVSMDTNSDGMLSWSELMGYFTATGAVLSDEEFSMLVGDMTTRVEMQLLAKSISG